MRTDVATLNQQYADFYVGGQAIFTNHYAVLAVAGP
jgi:hypothetical protein